MNYFDSTCFIHINTSNEDAIKIKQLLTQIMLFMNNLIAGICDQPLFSTNQNVGTLDELNSKFYTIESLLFLTSLSLCAHFLYII